MIQVLKTELIHHSYKVMSISSVQSYALVTSNISNGKVTKEVQLKDSQHLYEYYKEGANLAEKKAMQDLVDCMLKHNLV